MHFNYRRFGAYSAITRNALPNNFLDLLTSSAGWTIVSGSGDYTFSVSGLTISGVTGTKYILKNDSYLNSRHFGWEALMTVLDTTTTIAGGLGIGGTNNAVSSAGQYYLKINTTSGFLTCSRVTNGYIVGSTAITLSAAMAVSINDEIKITYEQDATNYTSNQVLITITNITTSQVVTGSVANANGYPSAHRFSIFSLGGAYKVTSVKEYPLYLDQAELVVMGDSLAGGTGATSFEFSYANILGSKFNSFAICSGPGDTAVELILCITKILLLQPKYVLIEIGVNDLNTGVAIQTYLDRIAAITKILEKNKITVYTTEIPPFGNANVPTANAQLSAYTRNVVSIYSPLASGINLAGAYNVGDNVHWNNAGHSLVANLVILAMNQ